MRLWATQTLLQWSLIIATLLSQTMRRTVATQGSCDGRCFLGYDKRLTCQCNYQCIELNDCCGDIQHCNNLASCATRCDANYNPFDDCHCDNRCERNGNCCFDYPEHCKPPTSSTEVPTLTTEANGDPSTSTTAVTNLTTEAYGDSGLIVVVILVICLVITSAIAAAVFILVRKRRTNPTTTENGSNAHGSGPTNVISGTGQEEQGSVYYSSVKESEYANQEEGFDSNFAYQIYEKQIFQDIVTT
ncbi:uncharacterized protein [Apostichopus japonicus]|uniref:uncharacterized protein isoform X2 n=1 Tax=Stichopus japonicus TaxID=307972 RepID=UPI003AB771C3